MGDVHSISTFDLPNAYDNDRIILIAKDPYCLYTYWEISEARANDFLNEFGHELWENSVPVLKVINASNNTNFYITINDIANNWYINVENDNCLYIVEIGRRISDKFFIPFESSNYVQTPSNSLSTNTSAYFADYKNIKKGVLKYESAEIYATYNLSQYYRGFFGISSINLFGMANEDSIYGPSSSDFFGFGLQNY